MILKNNLFHGASKWSFDGDDDGETHHRSVPYSSHTHPLSDASRLARDRFERGKWRFEDMPKPLSRAQSEEVRAKLGWSLAEMESDASRACQSREEADYAARDVVRAEDVDVDAREDLAKGGEEEVFNNKTETKKKCEAKTACGVAFETRNGCVDLCQSATFAPKVLPTATEEEKRDAFYVKMHFDYFQSKRKECPRGGLDATSVTYRAPERVSVGKHLANVAAGLARASAFNKTYVPGRLSMRQWTSAKRCGLNRNVMCFMKPMGKCLLDVRDKYGRQIGASMAGTAMFGAAGLFDFSIYRLKRRGTLMYQAEALSYIFEPNKRSESVIRAAFRDSIQKQVDYNSHHHNEVEPPERGEGHPFGKCVAVHVRRSGCVRDVDSHETPDRKEGICVPSKNYIEKAKEFAENYGLKSIVLISDDLNVAERCASNHDLPCFYITSTKRLLHDAENDVIENINIRKSKKRRTLLWKDSGKDRAVSAALATIIELEAARTCDAFVGQFSSGFSRLTYLLMSARIATPAPFVSLDGVPFHVE